MQSAWTRRRLLNSTLTAAVPVTTWGAADDTKLERKLGIVTASFTPDFRNRGGELSLIEFPKLMRDEWDLEVMDLNTMNFDSFERDYLESLKSAIVDAGRIATNLKMNQKVDMCSPDSEIRSEAMRVYKESIDVAQFLGLRWVRPLPRAEPPEMGRQLAALDELIDYAGERGITVLVENFGWMMDDSDSVVDLVNRIGPDRVGVGIDTGNWSDNQVRFRALEKTFPLAVTCDFKAKKMTESGGHPDYDLKRCFEIGWDAGFRGPWCFEHGGQEFIVRVRNIIRLRDSLERWMAEIRP